MLSPWKTDPHDFRDKGHPSSCGNALQAWRLGLSSARGGQCGGCCDWTESGACGPCCVAAWLHCAWKSAYMLLEQVWSLVATDNHGCQQVDDQLSKLLVKSALSG